MARQADKPIETEAATSNRYSTFNGGRGWLYGLIGLVVLVIVFIAGAVIGNHRNMVRGGVFGKREFGLVSPRRLGGGLGGGVNNAQNRITGVVTSVNGSNFTVAGNGATNDVTTTSSTQYQGGDSVKQNDTVVVYGSTSNGMFQATQVVVNP